MLITLELKGFRNPCIFGFVFQSPSFQIFDLSWIFGSFSLWSFWHWGVMQGVGYFTLVNVGSMLCPAPSDPFAGPGYRLVGIIHQFLAICFFGTLAAIVGQRKRLKHLNMKASGKMD